MFFVLSHCSNRKHSTVKVKPEYNELSYLVTRQCLHQEEFNQLSQYDRVKPTRKCSCGLFGIVEENSGLERGVLITSGELFGPGHQGEMTNLLEFDRKTN